MGFNLGSILGVAAPIIGGALGGPAGAAVGAGLGSMFGQRGAAQDSQQLATQDYATQLQAARPNQVTDFGSQIWTRDPSGQMTQTNTLNPQDAARLGQFRDIASGRMGYAQAINPQYRPIDWNSLGMGHLANAVYGTGGTTGQRPFNTATQIGGASNPLGGNMPGLGPGSMGGTSLTPQAMPQILQALSGSMSQSPGFNLSPSSAMPQSQAQQGSIQPGSPEMEALIARLRGPIRTDDGSGG